MSKQLPSHAGLPDYKDIRAILSRHNPNESTKALSLAFNREWPDWTWLAKPTSGVWYSAKIAVIDAGGVIISSDAKAWFAEQERFVGHEELVRRIKQDHLRLMRREGTDIYILGILPENKLDFVQICVRAETSVICSLQTIEPRDILQNPDTYPFDWNNAVRSTPCYECAPEDVKSSLDWLDHCKLSHREVCNAELSRLEERVFTGDYNGKQVAAPFLEVYPERALLLKRSSREERWFHDWSASSAGTQPMGKHWFLETHNYVDEHNIRNIGFVPQAVTWPKIRIKTTGLSASQLQGKLERFDLHMKCKFGWFFFMVHGNRITSTEGHVIAEAVRLGTIKLDPRDEAVLLAWDESPYGF
jgi:hypothetical protein